MSSLPRLLRLSFSALLLAGLSACAALPTSGGAPGGAPAPGTPTSPQPAPRPVSGQVYEGEVASVDHTYHRFQLHELTQRGGMREFYYDQKTQLLFNGQVLSPTGLERGDRIRVTAVTSGGVLWANGIEVLRDVRAGSGGAAPTPPPAQPVAFDAAIRLVDVPAQSIEITRGGYTGSVERIRFDANTRVEYRGQLYRPENLERGDLARIEARAVGNGQWLATRIVVTASVRER